MDGLESEIRDTKKLVEDLCREHGLEHILNAPAFIDISKANLRLQRVFWENMRRAFLVVH